MKQIYSPLKAMGFFALSLFLVNCAPSAQQIKEAVEKDPSIVFVAIEKNPEKFIDVVNQAAQESQKKAQEKAIAEEGQKLDQEFANPLKPLIDESRVIFGNKSAPITIVEYSDFECPYCSKGFETIKKVQAAYGDKVRVLFKHMPLDFHPKALPAAKYYEAAGRQSPKKAEEFHNLVFKDQASLRASGEVFLKKMAQKVGLDMKQLAKDLKDESLLTVIEKDIQEARKFEITGTPGFIVNGVSLRGAYPFENFKEIIDRHLKK